MSGQWLNWKNTLSKWNLRIWDACYCNDKQNCQHEQELKTWTWVASEKLSSYNLHNEVQQIIAIGFAFSRLVVREGHRNTLTKELGVHASNNIIHWTEGILCFKSLNPLTTKSRNDKKAQTACTSLWIMHLHEKYIY